MACTSLGTAGFACAGWVLSYVGRGSLLRHIVVQDLGP